MVFPPVGGVGGMSMHAHVHDLTCVLARLVHVRVHVRVHVCVHVHVHVA